MIRSASALTLLVIVSLFPGRAPAEAAELLPIPDKLVVLTFDDGNKSDVAYAAPLLKQYGFGATFFITEGLGFLKDKKTFLTWDDVRKLHDAGFEIGNHTRSHPNVARLSKEQIVAEVEHIERRCQEHGIPSPKTFCYPGWSHSREAIEVLKEKGYLFARRGSAPELPEEQDRGLAYDPAEDHPLLVPTTGASGPNWGWEDFVRAVDQAKDGKICVLTFHGVPALLHPWVDTKPTDFARYMRYLDDQGCTVIALRDLAKYVAPARRPSDPYAPIERRLGLTPLELKCEYASSPLGVDVAQPRLSWVLQSSQRGQMQSAYQILVASSEEKLQANVGDKWDSGKVGSDRSVNIAYQGKALASRERCWWKVRVWDKDGKASEYSKPAMFEMGLLKQNDWRGEWIGAGGKEGKATGAATSSAPLLRKEFAVVKKVERATAFVSGLGWYELYVNGRKVGDHVLDPATSDYHKRTLYVAYDVTDRLHQGANAVGVMLGNGWYCDPARKKYGDSPRLLLQMHVEFTDGTSMNVKTDQTWKTVSGPITRNDLYGGETYDARLEKPGWTSAGYDDAGWVAAEIKDSPGGKLQSQLMPPIKVNQTIKPVKFTNPKPGVYVYDMGQLFGGWARLRVKGPKGTKVTIKYSARIFKDSGLVDKRRHPAPQETDHYILKGDPQGEVYEPRFTYHPVRFVQIEGYPGKLTREDLDGRVVYSAVDMSGDFECSDPLLNRIHQNVVWTLTNELFGIPLDCLHREHWAWTDPATVAGTLYPRKHMPLFWTKWLDDIADAQLPSGAVPDVTPSYPGSRSDPAWGGNYPILVWYLHQYYADNRILEQHYAGMKKWIDYLSSIADNHLITKGHYGDHMLPGESPGKEEFISSETPRPLVWTGYYCRGAAIVSQAARLLGKKDDAERYARLAEQIKIAMNNKWLDKETNQYATGSQTANLFPLTLGIVPEANQEGVLTNVIRDIVQRRGGHLRTGNTGTTCMIDTLTARGHGKVMYQVATKPTYPGWGYMVKQGATTIWEVWGLANGAESMIMWATIDEFFYRDLAGIPGPDYHGPGYTAPGFRQMHIRPHVLGGLKHARASIRTVRGMVSSGWKKSGNSLVLEVTLPPGPPAKVSVPTMGLENVVISERSKTVWKDGSYVAGVAGITGAVQSADYITLNVGSGSYRFKLTGTPKPPK